MENNEQPNQKKSYNLFFMILSGVLTLVSIFLAYQLYNQKTITETVIVKNEKLEVDYTGVKADLEEVQKLYEGLQTNNKQLQSELDTRREEIEEIHSDGSDGRDDKIILSKFCFFNIPQEVLVTFFGLRKFLLSLPSLPSL